MRERGGGGAGEEPTSQFQLDLSLICVFSEAGIGCLFSEKGCF